MTFEIELLPEPKLTFGKFFEHEDTKSGLAEFGPYGNGIVGLHPAAINLGFVGTGDTISGTKGWVTACGQPIESQAIKRARGTKVSTSPLLFENEPESDDDDLSQINKSVDRDFIGFNADSSFASTLQMNDRWDRRLNVRELDEVLAVKDKATRILRLTSLLTDEIQSIATTSPAPNVIIVALTESMIKHAHSTQVRNGYYLDLRRVLKATSMKWGIPLQLIRPRSVSGGTGTQDPATRAWNLCTALYFKADGVAWTPKDLDVDTCYVGIDFHTELDGDESEQSVTLRAAVAQAFDHMGQGLVLRGESFPWHKNLGRVPHLKRDAAESLITSVLNEYVRATRKTPKRVVIHKSSLFWSNDHSEYDEVTGFHNGIESVFSRCEVDLVSLARSRVRFMREGKYPPLRGTTISLSGSPRIIYTMGYIPFLETYPGAYVPEPWEITGHHGGSAKIDLLREILVLSKMNVNNCSFADGTPITIRFAKEIGNIMKHVPGNEFIRPNYKFYM